tara:strand:- start:278 stop:772 length:495 start_codon:yes stop_codon:yes gene_type:complete
MLLLIIRKMKVNYEILISILVLFILYLKPFEITRYSNTILGKVVLLLGVAFVSLRMGKLPGLLAALVMIVLIYDNVEGFQDGNTDNTDENKAQEVDSSLDKINAQETTSPVVKSIEEKQKCEELKKELKEKLEGDFDFSQYDIKCKDGELKIKAFKNTIAATNP